jgi:PAS domain S-box-containing protein
MAMVLVAEDEPAHQRLMAEVVRRLGHEVTVADDGWAALMAATHRRPDLVVADIDMPDMDGLQLCRALHEAPELGDIPVVLVTALLLPQDPQLIASDAVAIIRKPFDVRELSATLTRILHDVAARPAPGAGDTDAALSQMDPIFLRAMVHCVDAGIAACDSSGRLTVFNGFLREFFGDDGAGVPVKEWVQQFGLRHHDGSPLEAGELPMTRALNGETVEHAGQLALDRNGRRRWLTINAHPVRDGETIVGAVAAVHDVTTEYRSRIYQTCKNDVLKALAESPSAADAVDNVIKILAITLGWPYVRLWSVDPLTERLRPTAIYTAEDETHLPLPASFAPGQGLAGKCWQRGEMLWVPDIHAVDSMVLPEVAAAADYRAAGAVPVRSGDQTTGVLTFFTYDQQEPEPSLLLLLSGIVGNISALREQRRAEELARNLAATTDDYIALVGHELRTPLTSITAYTELLTESPSLPPELRELVDVVDRNSRRLRDLIDQLLDLAALESGHSPLVIEDVDLATVVAATTAQEQTAASSRGITIDNRTAGTLIVPGDIDRLTQLVSALLDNAVKFSADGSTVTVTATPEEGTVTLTVTDNGAGLPTDEQHELFRRLYRGANARHRGVPGNGLGLALCRVITETHGGTITLAPHDPTGTTVTVRIPRTPAPS